MCTVNNRILLGYLVFIRTFILNLKTRNKYIGYVFMAQVVIAYPNKKNNDKNNEIKSI